MLRIHVTERERERERREGEHPRVLVDARVAAPRRVCCEGWYRGGEFARAETANDELIAPQPRVLVDASLQYALPACCLK